MTTKERRKLRQYADSEPEARVAEMLLTVLRPGLKVKRNGRIDTTWGDKTPLGWYRTIRRITKEEGLP